ncbi:cytochrome-c peroxidase [Desulfosarcina ovata]|uniref:Cytochrome-c peroxidase n=1 Tax=Desulfosarcina ovata subsp. ovata TaxID=2752305 RepID=A0A5K8A7H1_9BACT|nr:cytochrome c peroxidase [Desulfosarcina ovata]BBO88467.1 cytochrome-c peroxidase [Desulfosarcina ovata subsp. ovata]
MKKSLIIIGLITFLLTINAAGLMAAGQTLTDLERLGMHLYKDKNLSLNQNQSCQTCHHPLAGFADRSNFLHPYDKFVSLGSDGVSQGGRNAPTSAYAGYSPIRYYIETTIGDEIVIEYFGGMFWDGRATGETLGDPLAEQAQGPPTNPVEMAMPDEEAVIDVIKASDYYDLWVSVFGRVSNINDAYDNFGRAIAAYERSAQVTQFSSKYDVAGDEFTTEEENGLDLFESKCSACHATTVDYGAPAALFTTYGYANIGVPINDLVPLEGPDLGLGGDIGDTTQEGKFKIPTLRNIAMTAPYSHNGSFPTLYDMVSFINDRSPYDPEVDGNLSTLVGNLDLTEAEIDDIVAFLETLTDGY